jgi:hypothetical protein
MLILYKWTDAMIMSLKDHTDIIRTRSWKGVISQKILTGNMRRQQKNTVSFRTVAYPGIFSVGGCREVTEGFLGGGGRGSTNSIENRGQIERESGGGSPLVTGPTICK